MDTRPGERRLPSAVWTLVLVLLVVVIFVLTAASFTGQFNKYVLITVASERSGLVMEVGAKVRMHGVQVGRVAGIEGRNPVRLRVELFPDQVDLIPHDVQAEIRSTTAFGAKYIELIASAALESPIRPGAMVMSRNVTTEVNTVFENLVEVLNTVDPPKLNATLTAVAQAMRGQGTRIGEATTAANDILAQLNPLMDIAREDWISARRFADAYDGAGDNLVEILAAATEVSQAIVDNESTLDSLLLNVTGFAESGISLIGPHRDDLVNAINGLAPTITLLQHYSPSYTCMLLGAKWYLDHGGRQQVGGNGRTIVLDSALNLGDDPYRYPENLPIVAAKGGPGGKPGCGSLPDVSKQFPVRQLVTNTGWGTGVDIRTNPGIGHPWWLNLFPVTRGVPEPPSLRGQGPPATGPAPAPGSPSAGPR